MDCSGLISSQAAEDVQNGIEVGTALAVAAHQRAATASDSTVSCRCDRLQFMTVDEHKRHLIAAITAEIIRQVEGRLALTADVADDA